MSATAQQTDSEQRVTVSSYCFSFEQDYLEFLCGILRTWQNWERLAVELQTWRTSTAGTNPRLNAAPGSAAPRPSDPRGTRSDAATAVRPVALPKNCFETEDAFTLVAVDVNDSRILTSTPTFDLMPNWWA